MPSAETAEATTRVALVTGGGRGIGWATCQELVTHGWQVMIGDLDYKHSRQLATDHIAAVPLDVSDRSSVHGAANATMDRFGAIDLLVNNAGIQRHGPIENLSWEDWAAVIDVNLHGAFLCMQAVSPHMLNARRGAVVNVVSISAQRGTPGRAPYVAAKAALEGLTRTAAAEWADRGVRVNAVGPGYIDTPLLREFVDDGRIDLDPVLRRTPMRRLGQPHEIAKVIRFLASDDASFVTGQILYVDGGFLVDYGVSSAAAGRTR